MTLVVVVELPDSPLERCHSRLLVPALVLNNGTLLTDLLPGSSPTRGIPGLKVGIYITPISLVNPPPVMAGVLALGLGRVALDTASCTIFSIDEDITFRLVAMALLIMACRGVAVMTVRE